MSSKSCPDEEPLKKLLQGKLAGPAAAELEEHLLHCEACASASETISASDELTATIRSLQIDESSDEHLPEVIERAKRLKRSSDTAGIDETIVAQDLPSADGVDATDSSPHAEEIGFLAPAEEEDEIGRLGKYRVLQVLGVGGMGVVFRAEDPQLKRQIALKAMKPAVATSRSAKDRFIREAQATAAIEHDNIVHIYQVDEDRGVPFIAMPFLRGESLQHRLDKQGRLSQQEVAKIGREIADGLDAAHQRDLIHRDIKPDNIWLEEGSDRVKIVDFGLVRSADDDAGLTQSGTVLGTPKYMAPEQAQGQVVDHRCDLFSLGSVLYRLATGTAPFAGSNITATLIAVAQADPTPISEVQPNIDSDLASLIMRLLSKDADARPQTTAEVAKALAVIGRKLPAEIAATNQVTTGDPANVPTLSLERTQPSLPKITIEATSPSIARLRKKPSAARGGNRTKLIAAGLGGLIVLVAAITFFVRLGKYDVQITVDDPAIALKVDGKDVLIEGNGAAIRLSAGPHKLIVQRDGFETETDEFTVKKDGTTSVHVAIVEGNLSFFKDGQWPGKVISDELVEMEGSSGLADQQPKGNDALSFTVRWPLQPSRPEDIVWLQGLNVTLTLRSGPDQDVALKPTDPQPEHPVTIVGVKFGRGIEDSQNATDEVLKRLGTLTDLESLVLDFQPNFATATKDGLPLLKTLVHLRYLKLSGIGPEDTDPAFLAALPELQTLSLADSARFPWERGAVDSSSLQELMLYHTIPNDWEPFAQMPRLTSLVMTGRGNSREKREAAAKQFATLAPWCRIRIYSIGEPPHKETILEPTAPPRTSLPKIGD